MVHKSTEVVSITEGALDLRCRIVERPSMWKLTVGLRDISMELL